MATKMAAVGERDAVLAFAAVGLRVEPVESPDEAARAVNELARDGYSIILVTERTAQGIQETISKYKTALTPAIIPIPGAGGTNGYARAMMKANMEKAVGADILSAND
jgi:V/A-type H+-transporting ATPase subunit F